MAVENTSTRTTTQAAIANVTAGDNVSAQTFQRMLNVLNELVNHTHVTFDDYSTACNCNCNCNCTRGII
jgi:hypothetical protein